MKQNLIHTKRNTKNLLYLFLFTALLILGGCVKNEKIEEQLPTYFEGKDSQGGINDVVFNGPWTKNTLTWYVYRYSNKINQSETREVLEKAFKRWSDVCNLTFTEVNSQSQADITLGFVDDKDHWITAVSKQCPLKMTTGVLAHAFPPNQTSAIDKFHEGDVHLLDTWPWTPYGTGGASGQLSLLAVAIHEIGHSLGLTHSNNASDIMYPSNQNYTNLSNNDVIRIVNLYGAKTTSSLNPPVLISPSNNSTLTSSNVTFSWQGVSGASQYRIQISSNINAWTASNGFANGLLVDLNTSGTTYTWNNSQNNTTYYWSIKSISGTNNSNYSQPFQFTKTGNTSGNAIIFITPTSINFGSLSVGGTTSQTFTIQNNGTSNLNVSSVSSSNAAFNCNFSGTITSGSSVQATVTFSPSTAGNLSGTLTINSNAFSGSNTVQCSGTGVTGGGTPTVIPALGTFGNCAPTGSNPNCPAFGEGVINARVVSINTTTKQIIFEIKKCDATAFNAGGTFSINSGSLCGGGVMGSTTFSAGQFASQIGITENFMTGTKVYYPYIIQGAQNNILYNTPSIVVTY